MTKKIKDDKKTKNEKKLEEELKKESKVYEDLEKLEEENKKLQRKIKEQEEALKNTQLQYISLKNEFDSFSKRIKLNEKKQKDEMFEKMILKIIPIIELLISSYNHLPVEFKGHKWTEWFDIINKKINSFLEQSHIEAIKTIWEDIDETKHEVLGMEPVEDKKQKNKIIKEIKKWYILKKGNENKVLLPAKVIVWI